MRSPERASILSECSALMSDATVRSMSVGEEISDLITVDI